MLKDSERYILTTEKASVIRDVLSLVFAAAKPDDHAIPATGSSFDEVEKTGCDRMILELRRPKGPRPAISPGIRNLRVSRLGRVLVVTADATTSKIFQDIEALRRYRFFPAQLTSGLVAPVRSLFRTLMPVHPPN